ncbi:hypothetical protein BYT27DRAFT_7202720 [Phlegmacium glaucopus]|nr:hypothetical protein BYT27DRAFT_7202720 [Phlegmacium glaucopus]
MDPHRKPKSSIKPLLLATFVIFVSGILFQRIFLQTACRTLPNDSLVTKVVAVLNGDSQVTGHVDFKQKVLDGNKVGQVLVTGYISGLSPNSSHGFHVHESGDLQNGCLSTGGHYNPFEQTHGAPTDLARHVGDLGNIDANEAGVASFTFQDPLISLNGPTSILGRAVVVHAGTDDLGKGGNDESLKTGNAGGRVACGVIGIAW